MRHGIIASRQLRLSLLPAAVLGHAWQAAHGGTDHCDQALSRTRPILTNGGVATFVIDVLENCGRSFSCADVMARCPLLAAALGWTAA